MKPERTIEEACQRLISINIRAKKKARDEDAYWKDAKANNAYSQLCKAIDATVATGLHWWYTIWNIVGSVSDDIWKADEIDEATTAEQFTKTVLAHLEALKGHDWIATLPLEHLFNKFPDFTDFGGFYLINACEKSDEWPNVQPAREDSTERHDGLRALLERFEGILKNKLGILLGEGDDETSQSYLNLGDHYYRKSNGYIPGRPQMVMKVGVGDEFVNKTVLAEQVRYQVALLSICQIAYELEAGVMHTNLTSPGQCRLPMGEWMQDGLIEVPNCAVGIVAKTGYASLWGIPQVVYETQYGIGYKPEEFMAVWNDIAAPLLTIRHTLSGEVGDAIRNALSLVAKCRHSIMGDLVLNSVIATETILNPFSKMGTSEGFAVFAAKLTGTNVEDRLKTYKDAKRLYNLRNLTVHRSQMNEDRRASETNKAAFALFRSCFKGIVQWVSSVVNKGGKCDDAEFRDFYLRTILS